MEQQMKKDVEVFGQEETEYRSKQLTNWKNEPLVSDFKKDLEEASSHHQAHVNDVGIWLDNLNVEGGAKIEKIKGRSTVVPQLIRKQAEWRYAALSEPFLSDEDLFDTAPVTWEDRDAAIQNGLILNNQFNTQIDKTYFIDTYVRAAVDEGSVVVRTGWDFQEEEQDVPNMVQRAVQDPDQATMIFQGIELLQQNPQAMEDGSIPDELLMDIQLTIENGMIPTQLVQDGTKKEMVTIVNKPTVDVCDYSSVTIDPTCKGEMSKANFVIYAFETSLTELEKAGKYHNLDKIEIETHSIQNEPDATSEDTSSFNFQDKPRKKFIAYEYWGYWDKDGTGITKPILGTWVGNTLIRLEDSPFRDGGLPFTLVQYLPKRKSVYGEPDGALLADNQKISGAVTRGMLDIMGRSAAGQTGIRKDALDVTNQRKFDSGKDYMFNANVDANSAFFTNVYPEIPRSAIEVLMMQNTEAEALTGVKAYSGGISGDALGKVATGVRGALDAASKRELGILRRLSNGIIDIGRKIIAMNAEFLSEEEVVRITNDEFVKIKRDDLEGNIDIRLVISTAEADNAKAEELAFMLQTTGPNSDPGEVRMIRAEIARLRKMPDLAKKIEEYQPQPDPLQQQIQMLEIRKLEAEIEKLQSETAENYAEAELDQAKTRETHATADDKDLQFLEEESGVNHARDMEKNQAQAEANMDLKLLDHALKGGNESTGKTQ
jgi:hypothetical protein